MAEASAISSPAARLTRADWLAAARRVLIAEGVAEVKVLTLARGLGAARSSFYWRFKNREDLLQALLEDWRARNTEIIVERCALPAKTISEALCNLFTCFIDETLFDPRLDFAVRDWSRRDEAVRALIDAADRARLAAIAALFARHGFDADEADVRARIVYFMQLGYHALKVSEPMVERMRRLEGYLKGFTGQAPDPAAVEAFHRLALATGKGR